MGYVDKQIAAARKTLGDAVAGKGLQKAIKALQEKSQIKDSLADARKRGAITAKRKTAKRTSGTESGLSTEIRELTSSDGLLTLRYQHVLGING
jgi:hypothetical protein